MSGSNFLCAPTPVSSASFKRVAGGRFENRKEPLGTGKSLNDWIRLHSSGVDLSGTGGKLLRVNEKDLKLHNQRQDAWIILNGLVFNVTAYLDYHPGGIDQLMRAAGTDATDLFNKYHAWINWEPMLKNCLVGRFVGDRSKLPIPGPDPSIDSYCLVPTSGLELKIKDVRSHDGYRKISLIQKSHLTDHCYLFVYQLVDKLSCSSTDLPVGCHLILRRQLDSESFISRPYTPVSANLLDMNNTADSDANGLFHFAIKIYPKGQFTRILQQAELGSQLAVSDIKCNFDIKVVNDRQYVYLLAAGTGITPFVNFIRRNICHMQQQGAKLSLLYFNRTIGDILLKSQLDSLSASFDNFSCRYFLSDDDGNEALDAHVVSSAVSAGIASKDLLERHLPVGLDLSTAFFLICGPTGFNETCCRLLTELHCPASSMHAFE